MFRNLRAKSESIFSGFISDFDNKQKNCFKHNTSSTKRRTLEIIYRLSVNRNK